jgi:hypothetical protein
MHVINVGPINNNPQTSYTLVFGQNVPGRKVLNSLQEVAEMRQECGLTTKENTIETVREAQIKLVALGFSI